MLTSNNKYKLLLLISILMYSCTPQQKIDYGRVEGRVVNFDGSPLKNAKITINAPGQIGRLSSDSDGAYKRVGVQTGVWKMDFHCPSVNYIGRRISTEVVSVNKDMITRIDKSVPELYCYEPPYSEISSIYTGYFSSGFESSEFIPCNEELLHLSKNLFFKKASIWVDFPNYQNDYLKPNTLYFIKAKGTLKGPGSFGHLGGSLYLLNIESIIYKQKVRKQDCTEHSKAAT